MFQKGSRAAALEESVAELVPSPNALNEPAIVNDYRRPKDPVVEHAEEVVRFFHKTVHNVDHHYPQVKEIGQALSLISQYGEQDTRHIVQYAARMAAETNFKMQHFGAVLAYASRALDELDQKRRRLPDLTVPGPQRVSSEEPRYEIGERRLGYLSPEQYERRFEKAKADLLREQPFLAQAGKHNSSLVSRNVRSRIVRELEVEPMDLVVFNPTLATKYPWLYHRPQNLPL